MESFINKDSSDKPRPIKMRNLIVNNVQRYRLEVNSRLVYAKGLVVFDINRPVDGAGNLIDYTSYLSNLYAFYDDGFYSYSTEEESWVKKGEELDKINSPSSTVADFQGWYTTPKEDGYRINSLSDLLYRTSLFNYSSDWKAAPQVTLYARWKVKECHVSIRGISIGTLSMKFDGKDVSSASLRVPYNTEIVSYLGNKIGGRPRLQINSYYLSRLDGTAFQQIIRHWNPPFLGWGRDPNMTEGFLHECYLKEETIILYPQFYPLVIWPKCYYTKTIYHSDGSWTRYSGYSGHWFNSYRPPVYKEDVSGQVEPGYYHHWSYSDIDYPIGSNQVIVLRHVPD